MSFWEIVVLSLSILLTISWCYNIRQKAKNEQRTEKALELQGFLMSVAIVIVLLFKISIFHLLWMLPVSFILGLLSMNTPLKLLWAISTIYFLLWYIGIKNKGRKLYVDGEYKKAIEVLLDDVYKRPTAEKYFNLGLAYGKTGQTNREIGAYLDAIELNPNRPEVYLNLGTAYVDNNSPFMAIESYEKALELNPQYLKAQFFLCKVYAEMGDFDNANLELTKLKKLNSNAATQMEEIISKLKSKSDDTD